MSGLAYTARHPATAYTNVASVIMQLVASADTPLTVKKMQLQSGVTSAGQAIVVLQAGRYVTPHASGTTGTPQAINRRAASIAAEATFRFASATLGTTLTIFKEWQWNIAMPWEEQFGDEDLDFEIPAGDNFVLLLPNASGTPTLSGGIDFVER
jgi:hypothetical protein